MVVVKDSMLNAMLPIPESSLLDNHRKYDVVQTPQTMFLIKISLAPVGCPGLNQVFKPIMDKHCHTLSLNSIQEYLKTDYGKNVN